MGDGRAATRVAGGCGGCSPGCWTPVCGAPVPVITPGPDSGAGDNDKDKAGDGDGAEADEKVDALVENASDLGEDDDDMSEVKEHIDDGVEDKN